MRAYSLLCLLILSLIACCIEIDISVPSFLGMCQYFQVSQGCIQRTIAYNFVGFCLASFVYGPLSDCFGRRKIMLIGNALLLVGALGCVIAPTINTLLLARFIQGLGASTSAVVAFAIVADTYDDERATSLIGMMNAGLTIFIAAAPIAGIFINNAWGWRGNYAFVFLICLISWLFLFWKLPETKNNLAVFSFSEIVQGYQKLIKSSIFMTSCLAPSLLYAAYVCFVASSSFLYVETLRASSMAYAMHQGFIISCFSLVSIFSGKIIQKFGKYLCLIVGMLLSFMGISGFVIISLMNIYSMNSITFCITVFALGFAIFYPIIFSSSLQIFPEIKGTASSLIMSCRALLVAGFVALTSAFYSGHPLSVSLVMLAAVLIVVFLTAHLQRIDES